MKKAVLEPRLRFLTSAWIVAGYIVALSSVIQCIASQIVVPTSHEVDMREQIYAYIWLGFPTAVLIIIAACAIRRGRQWGRITLELISWVSISLLAIGVFNVVRQEGDRFDIENPSSMLQIIFGSALTVVMFIFLFYSAIILRHYR